MLSRQKPFSPRSASAPWRLYLDDTSHHLSSQPRLAPFAALKARSDKAQALQATCGLASCICLS